LPELVRRLDAAGVEAEDVSIRRPTLDEVFLAETETETETTAVSERRGAAASGLRSDDRGTREERRGKMPHSGAPERAGDTA
jgi:ABC-2 type transport system ATP-binding protein